MEWSQVLFGVCAGLTLYTYAGYPLGLLFRFRPRPGSEPSPEVAEGSESLPPLSMIIPAYNEERVIARKIKNSLELDYPESLLEIVVVSDGSSDATESVAREAAGERVRLVFREDRQGKTACINAVLPHLHGEIIVFTDANAYFETDALRRLVERFGDPRVGCVMGELQYRREDSLNSYLGEGLYWRYENFVKDRESQSGSTIVGNGAIYAMRRSLCRPLPPEVEADVANPLLALSSGHRVVFERQARCWERPAETVREEFSRKTRIITNQITSYLYGWKTWAPLPAAAAFQILSHKILRWLVPGFLAGIFVATAVSPLPPLDLLVLPQVTFYVLALIGWGLETAGKPIPRLVFVPYYFCAVNLASLKGIIDFLLGRRRVIWEKARSTR